MALDCEVYYGADSYALTNPRYFLVGPQELDSVAQEWFVKKNGLGIITAPASVGDAFPGVGGAYVNLVEIDMESDLSAIVRVEGVGMLSGSKSWRSISAFGREVAIGPTEKTPGKLDYIKYSVGGGLGTRWNIAEPLLVVRDNYFTSSLPDTSAIGTAVTPSNAPATPAYPWAGADPIRLQHPYGWVLESRDPEEVVPGTLWRCVDVYSYRHPGIPD